MDFLADATKQAQSDGADPLLLGLLNESVPGVSGIAESYLLLRKEAARNPAGVSKEIQEYRLRVRSLIDEAAKRNANIAAFRAESLATLATLDAVDTAIKESTKQIPIVGNIVSGLLQISDMFVQSHARLQAEGVDDRWGGIVFGAGDPVFWGWRSGNENPLKGGYWIMDVPILSFQAPMAATKFAAQAPSFARQHIATAKLASAFPYGFSGVAPEIDKITVSNSGYIDVQDSSGNYVEIGDKPGLNRSVEDLIAAFSVPTLGFDLTPTKKQRFSVSVKEVLAVPPTKQESDSVVIVKERSSKRDDKTSGPRWVLLAGLAYLAYKGAK